MARLNQSQMVGGVHGGNQQISYCTVFVVSFNASNKTFQRFHFLGVCFKLAFQNIFIYNTKITGKWDGGNMWAVL